MLKPGRGLNRDTKAGPRWVVPTGEGQAFIWGEPGRRAGHCRRSIRQQGAKWTIGDRVENREASYGVGRADPEGKNDGLISETNTGNEKRCKDLKGGEDCVLSCSVVFRLFVTPWTVACQAPLSMRFSRQEHWIGLPFLSSRNLPDSGIEPESPALQADSLPFKPQGKPKFGRWWWQKGVDSEGSGRPPGSARIWWVTVLFIHTLNRAMGVLAWGVKLLGWGLDVARVGHPGHCWLSRSEALQRDRAGDLGNLNGKGSQCKDRVVSCRVLAQSTKSPQNSKRQESMNTETDISPVNPARKITLIHVWG